MKTPVSIVKGGEVEDRVAKALDLLGAKNSLNLREDANILIKPNLGRVPVESKYANYKGAYELTTFRNNSRGEGDIAHPEVIRATIKAFLNMGFKNITIGEASGGCWTDLVYKALDIYRLSEELGVKVTDLNWEDAVKMSVPRRMILDYVWVPRSVFEADLVVSLPSWKVFGDHVSLGLKNVAMGILPAKYYGFNKAGKFVKGLDEPIHKSEATARLGKRALDAYIVDICSVVPIGLTVIDGTSVVHGDKHAERADLIFAGLDPVATDTVAVMCMSFDPKEVAFLEMAAERGLGTNKPSEIEVIGEPIEKTRLKVIRSKGFGY